MLNLRRSLFLAAAVALTPVGAQRTNATCLSSMSWMTNQLGQNPCLVSVHLRAVCNPRFLQLTLPPLPNTSYYYSGPWADDANSCECSTVTYNLAQACGACQGGEILTWAGWRANCTSSLVNIAVFPFDIPPGTSVPQWAYIDSSARGFDVVTARQVAAQGGPESTYSDRNPPPTSTSRPAQSATVSPTPPPTPNSSKETPVGIIVGSVVGGVLGLLLLIVLLLYLVKRKRESASPPPMSAHHLPYDTHSPLHSPMEESFKYNPTSAPLTPSPPPVTPMNQAYNTNGYWQGGLQTNR